MDILAEINRVMDLEGRTLAKLRAAVAFAVRASSQYNGH
jgi:hypothetical protein